MACFHPLKGWRSKELTANGKRKIVFNYKEGYLDMPLEIPCGQCRGCRLERSRQWAIRCVHEAQMHTQNCFITLTYNNENIPNDNSLNLEHFQKFIKKLRKKYGSGIRYFHCGEYGEEFSRPHYHACIFNFDFPDKRLYKISEGNRLYNSRIAEDLWDNKGYAVLGDVTFKSAAYVARYIMKKVNGQMAEEHYQGKKPEYVTMSRRPGIGKNFFDKYSREMYKDDMIIINGKKMRVPKYYDGQQELSDPDALYHTKISREIKGEKHADNNTPDRLAIREKIQELKIKKLKRGLENEI